MGNYEPYGKHQLYKGRYHMSPSGKIKVPDHCYWQVEKYLGNRRFGSEPNDVGPICLLLKDEYGDWGFWSVISFLTEDEAKGLAAQLLNMVTSTKHIKVE